MYFYVSYQNKYEFKYNAIICVFLFLINSFYLSHFFFGKDEYTFILFTGGGGGGWGGVDVHLLGLDVLYLINNISILQTERRISQITC